MEYKIVFYIISIIIYFIYSANKASNKRKALQEQKKYTTPKKTWEDELKEILQKTLAPQPEQEVNPGREVEYEPPVRETYLDTVPEKSEAGVYEEQRAYEQVILKDREMYSVETDTTSLANHVAELEAAMEKKPERPSLGLSMIEKEGFDARKAFLYSEIFRAPYLEHLRY